ncbi:MAG: DsbA family protein [Methylocystis silviterrae]
MTRIDFWYEFASTNSYPAAMRVEVLTAARGVEVTWRPFLLGPLFALQGWRDSPFNIYPVKGRYMRHRAHLRFARFPTEAARPISTT